MKAKVDSITAQNAELKMRRQMLKKRCYAVEKELMDQ